MTLKGLPLSPNRTTQMVRQYIDAASVGKRGSCHLFRHTMATLLLEHGCDIRYIQAMLGHAELSTTQIYTQVSIRKLKEIHAATHPSAKLNRPSLRRTTGGPPASDATPATEEQVLADLAKEAEEEAS
ncbi:MAG: tyrosine-type recombinase/integrase [Polyangiaceae bacterium]|nr:tyrosine-type recombinase/integrase [Polyangiaceae bacterium]